VTGQNGRDLIPLTTGEARRLFNLNTRVIRPRAFHEQWSEWRRYRQAAARKSHYARRNGSTSGSGGPGHVTARQPGGAHV